jgi:cobalt/nickel transport system permease protein
VSDTLQVSILWLLPLLLLPLAVYCGFRMLIGNLCKEQREENPDWSVPRLEYEGDSSSAHRWDVRFKLASFLLLAFSVVSLQHPQTALAALFLALLSYPVAAIPWRRGFKRLLGMTGFLSMFLLMLPLTAVRQSGDLVLVFGGIDWLGFNLRGLDLALLIILRASAVALLMEPLLATAPLTVTVAGLARMGVPRRLTELLLISHRYIYVFVHEARRMQIGMDVRGFRKSTSLATLRSVGNYVGMLFVRSFERTERVHAAMLARGYQGHWPQPISFNVQPADYLKAGVVIGLGLLLVVCDQFFMG